MAKNVTLAFMRDVQSALRQQGADHKLDLPEFEVVQAGLRYGIGAYDTSCQIIANRADKRSN